MGRDLSLASVIADASEDILAANATIVAPVQRKSSKSLHVLTLTPFFPTAEDDARGCFVAEPLPSLTDLGICNTVIAVQPLHRTKRRVSASHVDARWLRYFCIPGNLGLPASGRFLFSRILSQVRRIHRSHPVDLIHAHSALPCGHAAALLRRELGIPYVVTVHGLDAYSANQAGGLAGPWCRRVSKEVYRAAACVICVSGRVLDQLTHCDVKAVVVYNGVDPQMFLPLDQLIETQRILSVGNLIPIKGHEIVLRAIAAIQAGWPSLEYDVIGDGPLLSHLHLLARQLGIAQRVHFLGRQNRHEVAAAMSACTIFALPSRYEGLGCVYLEAMAAGKPVIACRGQGIEEVIQHGANGWLTAPDSVAELANSLAILLESADLRRDLGEAARRTIRNNFTLSHQAERLSQIYRECAR